MIYAYNEKNEHGNYQSNTGERYIVYTAVSVHGAKRSCWQEFDSLEDALATWELEPIPEETEIEQ